MAIRSSLPLKDHWKEQRIFLSRVVAAAVLVVLLSSVLIVRLVQLQVIDFQRFSELSQGNRIRIEPLAPTRGLIYDRNGLVLAENVPTWQLVAIPEQIDDIDGSLAALEELGLVDPSDHAELVQLIHSHRGFERVTLANLDEKQAARFAVRRHHFSGVDIQEGLLRYYPFGKAAAHAVGYVSSISTADLNAIDRGNYAATSQIGKTGVERSYETLLHGQVGYRQQVVNAQGRVLFDPVSDADAHGSDAQEGAGLETRWPVPGKNVVLSLDMRLQLAAQKALKGQRGAVVAIDPRNGDLLAMVSMPSFDPNRFAKGLSHADFVALNRDPDKPLFDRAIAGRYPPGSTIKPFLALDALYHETMDPSKAVYCPGYYTLPGSSHRYRDWRPQGHGDVDMRSAIVESCDVYFYELAVKLGIEDMARFLKSFGFGRRTGIDISGESPGLVPSPAWKKKQFARPDEQVWFPGETVITGIGQGYTQVTPLQLAAAGAALAERGARYRPRLLIGTEDALSRKVDWVDPKKLKSVADIEKAHWHIIQDAMVGVTTDPRGTGYRVMHGAPYSVAGKTGTAQVFSVAQTQRYDQDKLAERLRDHGLFFGYAPADKPRIVVAVVVENDHDAAVPVARAVLDTFFKDQAADQTQSGNYVAKQP